MSERQRTYASGVSLQLGLFNLVADLVPVRKTNSTKAVAFKQVCPDGTHAEVPQVVKQQYVCDGGHGPFTSGELSKAREIDGVLVPVGSDDHEAIKGDDPVGVMDLHVCPVEQIELATRPGADAYRIRLDKKNTQADRYALLLEAVKDPTIAIYGMCRVNARGASSPYRLTVWRDQLLMQGLIRPDDLAEADEITANCDEKLLAMGKQLIEASKADFDPTLLVDGRIQRIEDVLAGRTPTPVVHDAPSDLAAMLEASLKAVAA